MRFEDIPTAEAPPVPASPSSPGARPLASPVACKSLARILVIDDDPVVSRLVEKCLEGDFAIRKCFGAPAEGQLDIDAVDLIILDYVMPVRDGFEVLAEIRAINSSVPVIFLTAFGDPSVAERALYCGANRFLTKPVGPAVLREAVRGFFKSKATSDATERQARQVPFTPAAVAGDSRQFHAIHGAAGPVDGEVVRFSALSAVIEFDNAVGIRRGDVMHSLSLKFGRQLVQAVEGMVREIDMISPSRGQAKIVIPGGWRVTEVDDNGRGGDVALPPEGKWGDSLARFPQAGQERQNLPAAFRLAVHELVSFLTEVMENAVAVERSLADLDGLERLAHESAYVREATKNCGGEFWEVMENFEMAAEEVTTPELRKASKKFARRELFPVVLCSPFLARIVERPIGVPGDYGMLGQILGNPLEGHSLFDRILNGWILESGAAYAYRYRVALLEREIRTSIRVCSEEQREAKILSMASGVAYEVQHFVQKPEKAGTVGFSLVDFSNETLEEARRQFSVLGPLPRSISLGFHRSSVIDLANRARGLENQGGIDFEPSDDYDHVYCAGLFDYLSDRLIQRVTSYLYSILRPGGTLVVSNYTPDNPLKGLMTIVLDWELVYRSPEKFESLIRDAVPNAKVHLELDNHGAEVYALIRK